MNNSASSLISKRTSSDKLGRYYTKLDVGGLLISEMTDIEPIRVLDLGVGSGSLSRAALKKWGNIELLTVDVDNKIKNHLKNLIEISPGTKHNHIHADALGNRLPKILSTTEFLIDAAVCNPPFIIPKWRNGYAKIIEEAGFSGNISAISDVDAALLFLAQNLRLLSPKATLGIIVPDSIVSASKYRLFREELLRKYTLKKVIRLPRHSFVGTDAQAHILIIGKGLDIPREVSMMKFDADLGLSKKIAIDIEGAIERLDFDYHSQQKKLNLFSKNTILLGDIAHEVKRGRLSSIEVKSSISPALHTTHMHIDFLGLWRNLSEFGRTLECHTFNPRIVRAQPGDILMARVGRNLESKIFGINAGYPVLSDCVYLIRVPESIKETVLKQLSSPPGQAWIRSRCYGVSAKHISKADILKFPISL